MSVLQRLGDAARRFAGRGRSGAVILCYHRVADPDVDPWGLSVSPSNFAAHLRVIRALGVPVPLSRIPGTHDASPPPRGIVVTLDDGYADSLLAAKPALEEQEVPATVFVTTGNVGTTREFWWDELERILLYPGTLPDVLEFAVNGTVHRWDVASCARYTEDEYRRDRRVYVERASEHSRPGLYYSVWKVLFPVADDDRQRALKHIAEWAGDLRGPREAYRSLGSAEIVALARGGLVDIGAHTVTHPALPMHAAAAQRREIHDCRAELRRLTGDPVTAFSYPHGEHSSETTALVRSAGFESACTVSRGTVWSTTDRFALPRFIVNDWPGPEFEARLSAWLSSAG